VRGRTARRKNTAGLKERVMRGRGEAGGGRRRSAQRRPEGELHRRQCRRAEEQRGFRGRRREGGGPGDWFVKTKNFRDPTEKKDFSLI
jgi:hypothetical protein